MYGFGGNDRLIIAHNATDIWAEMRGGNGNDYLEGGAGNDDLRGEIGNDTMYGGAGNDKMKGSNGNDTMYGGAGNDKMDGGRGNDTMYGGAGNDTMTTTLNNPHDRNSMYGGAGNDTMILRDSFYQLYYTTADDGHDTVTGFADDEIHIDSTALLDGMTGIWHTSNIAEIQRYIDVHDNGTDTVVSIDADGMGDFINPEVSITLEGWTGHQLDLYGMLNNTIIAF